MTIISRARMAATSRSQENITIVAPPRFLALGPLAFIFGVLPLLFYILNSEDQASLYLQNATAAASISMIPFSLLVTLKFTAEEHKETFLNDIAPLAIYVKEKEPETIAYEVLLSDKDPLRVLIMERYMDKDNAYLTVHRSSQQFLDFRPKLQALQEAGHVTIDGESYLDSGVGFGDRAA